MTYGVTPTGFKAKKFADIVTDVGSSLLTELGIDIDSDPDSVAKVITNIFSLALADEWNLPQSLQSMFDIDKAEGKHLDDLVGYVGLSRLKAAASNGNQYITGNQELSIPFGSEFKDSSGNVYSTTGTLLVTKSSCVSLTLELAAGISIGNVLTVIINGVTSTVTVTTTVPSALVLLLNSINNSSTNLVLATDTSVGTLYSFTLVNDNDKTPSIITNTANLLVKSITSFGNIVKNVNGAIGVLADTVTTAPAISNITSVTNRYAFTVGRLPESDIDLRIRHSLSLAISGAATVEAIRSDLLVVEGVTTAFVIENDTLTTSAEGIPPKSFLSVVKGGLDQDIGNALWLTKGAGIETHGGVQVTVIDSQGESNYVNFSRPTPVYVHANVDYTLYSEQSGDFPTDGVQQIKDQLLAFGSTLSIGEDIVPQRVATQLFNTLGGLGIVTVTIGSTTGANDPTPTLTSAILPVSKISEASFSTLRITVAEV